MDEGADVVVVDVGVCVHELPPYMAEPVGLW
jgi:hypothetical protein